jgi:hypothetical protein
MRTDDTLAKTRSYLGQNGLSRLVDLGRCHFGRFSVS